MKNLLVLIFVGATVYYFITHGLPKAERDQPTVTPASATAVNSEPAPGATPHTNFLKSPIDRARAVSQQERQRAQESP